MKTFADLYAVKWKMTPEKAIEKLWGDNFYNPKTKKWTKKFTTEDGQVLQGGFVQFVLAPIKQLFDAIMNSKPELYNNMLERLEISLPNDAKDLSGKLLLKKVMQTWLPVADTLLEMVIRHLPYPFTAQKYRVESLFGARR